MCGFTGLINKDFDGDYLAEIARRMSKLIAHRGPDGYGNWTDGYLGISLSHQRLSIIDLSDTGKQPMESRDGRYILTFNGEIYNHVELRDYLKNSFLITEWRGTSDTEVLLKCIEVLGIQDTLKKIVGMFAFSVLDKEKNKLILVRDRFGEKPLYYGFLRNLSCKSFYFSSDIKSFKAHPFFINNINKKAFIQYVKFGYLLSPNSIYENTYQLKPGHLIEIDIDSHMKIPKQKEWWSFLSLARESIGTKFNDQNEAIEKLENVLNRSIIQQSYSDVKMGAFLSGGIDSSLVVSLLNKNLDQNINTFTIGFKEKSFDESIYAEKVASVLATQHNTSILESSDLIEIIPNLPNIYSEPFADSSQIPTFLVCREARRLGLKVCLTGDGADELFGGYNRYLWSKKIWKFVSWLPFNYRFLLSLILKKVPDQIAELIGKVIFIDKCKHKLIKLADRMAYVRDIDDLYISLISVFPENSELISSSFDYWKGYLSNPMDNVNEFFQDDLSSLDRMMFADSIGYLPNDILTKVDRASMAVGLETRAPFLDHRVAEIALSLPNNLKINSKIKYGTKIILRKILEKYIPSEIINRPKTGFGLPIGYWLKGPLKEWSYDLIDQDNSFFNLNYAKKLFHQHNYQNYDHTEKLWSILMWQLWHSKNER